MNKRNRLLLIFAVILTSISVLFVKCKEITDPAEGLKLIINYNVIKTTLSVTFLDAATGEPVGYNTSKVVNVNLQGQDADKILDVTGANKTSFNSAEGFLGFGVDPSYTPTHNDPLEFTIVANCDGYASTSLPVKLWEESHRSLIIHMVDLNNLPKGVVSKTDYSTFVSDTAVDNEVVIETPAAGTTGTKATLIIRQGTVIKDAGGNILTGNITTNLVYYNNMDDEALAAFPGGLSASVNINGNSQDVLFYSGGFASIEIADATGKIGETFENHDLELIVEVSDNTYNKNTAAQIEDQDTVPLWSYDLETGQWDLEGWTLIEEVGGIFQTTAEISHLSFYNLDWWFPFFPGPPFPSARIQFEFPIKNAGAVETIPLEITVRKKEDNTYINKFLIQAPIGEEYPIGEWGLGNVPVMLEIRNMCDINTYQTEEISDPSQGLYTIILQNAQPTNESVTVYFEGWCPNNPDIIIRPSIPFVYKDECEGGEWIWSFMHEGFVTLYNMKLNHLYRVGVYYDGELFEEGFTFDDPNLSYSIEFTQEVCDIIGQ